MLKDILGTDTYQHFSTQMWFAFIGVIISLLWNAANRDSNSPTTPYHFDPIFLIKDNWKRILLPLLLIYVTIRFFPDITGLNLSLFWCCAVGIGYDRLGLLLKTATDFFKVQRPVNPK